MNVNIIHLIYRASYFALGNMKTAENWQILLFIDTLTDFLHFLRHNMQVFRFDSKAVALLTHKIVDFASDHKLKI